jgi:hypothetical protein
MNKTGLIKRYLWVPASVFTLAIIAFMAVDTYRVLNIPTDEFVGYLLVYTGGIFGAGLACATVWALFNLKSGRLTGWRFANLMAVSAFTLTAIALRG